MRPGQGPGSTARSGRMSDFSEGICGDRGGHRCPNSEGELLRALKRRRGLLNVFQFLRWGGERPTDVSSTEPTNKSEEPKSSGGWWDSWLSSAKTKSAEVYSMVKKDLDEIGTAVKCEASHVFNTTSNVIGKTLKLDEPESPANVMKKSFSTFIGQVSTVLNPEPDDEDDTEVILSSGDTTMLSTYKKELEALQRVDATFIVPACSAEFDAWRSTLEGDAWSTAAKKLRASPLLKAQYERLVPDAVSHEDFWERYMFRVALLQDRLAAAARSQPALPATEDPVLAHLPIQTSPKKTISPDVTDSPVSSDDKDVAWEHEDFTDDVELTEEQQTLLLEEYEKEITQKKKQTIGTNTKDVVNNNANSNKSKAAQTKQNVKNKETQSKKITTPKKAKADECGNNLVEDYFADNDTQKDDASANSDESWEKEFEIDDIERKT
ncbi:BSD domain-containing protein 1 [Eumeta japonica]|uniref:BSD domain-containing protein 1 n=1 Tax=Eumeta variegata TaxID=151549 RepID=A0A4C1XQR8_EUMVA|nr:BSD domain-containing protein 1 [Eumeta japonica]